VGQRGYFYVGGQYIGEDGKNTMRGQVYVEVVAPKDVRHPYPLVLIHGNAQTPTNWMGTPDGRKGWADFFVEQGYIVYMMEQPMRGRSAWHPSDGATRMFRVDEEERLFTDNARSGEWPQAKKQTQWPGEGPGKGKKGDPVFDAFYATQVEALASTEETEKANQAAGAADLIADIANVGDVPQGFSEHAFAGPTDQRRAQQGDLVAQLPCVQIDSLHLVLHRRAQSQ